MRGLAVVVGVAILGLALLGLGAVLGARSFAVAQLSHRIGRPAHVDGEMTFRPGLHGLTVRFTRLHVEQAAWAGTGPVVFVDQGVMKLPWTALFGDVRLQEVQLDGLKLVLRRDAKGRVNWSDGAARRPPHLPRILKLGIRNGSLDYQDLTRALTFQGAITVAENAMAVPVLTVRGHGRSEDGVWSLDARSTTDFAGSAPYVLSGHLVLDKPSGRSIADFSGRLTPLSGGHLQGRLEGTGSDLHDLSHLINVPLPRTPPYQLSTEVDRTAKAMHLQSLSGRIGASDLAGALTITPTPGGRKLEGALHSRSLRITDLLSVATGGKLTPARLPKGRFLPDAAINPVPLRKLTGAIRFSAASVQAPTTPTVRSLELRATFDHGRVAISPMTLKLAHGQVVVNFVVDVRGAIPQVRLDADLQRADTADFHKPNTARPPLQAAFDGGFHLQGYGPSLSQAAAHASGDIQLRALNGRLQQTQAAVLSANLVHGVVSLLSHSHADVAMRCAVARFKVTDGKARATSLHMATSLGGVTGYGGFDLGAETLDLTLRPQTPGAPDVTSVRIEGPITGPKATLALDNPTGIVRHALNGLLHPVPPSRTAAGACN